MKAIVVRKAGPPDTLSLESGVPIPEPGKGELRIRVHASSLNPADYSIAEYGLFPKVPHVLGLDVAGVVEKVGEGATGFSIGDRVALLGNFLSPFGGFGEYAITETATVSRIPDGLSFAAAASFPCAGLTAYHSIFRRMKPEKGKTILIVGAAGGVGGYAVQFARLAGLQIIATCSEGHFEFVRSLGAHHVVDYTKEDVSSRVRDITNGVGVDYAIDTVSAESATKCLKMLAFNGSLACIRAMPDMSVLPPYGVCPTVHEVSLGAPYTLPSLEGKRDMARMGEEIMGLMTKKLVSPMITTTCGLAEIPTYLQKLRARHVSGKIVVSVVPEK